MFTSSKFSARRYPYIYYSAHEEVITFIYTGEKNNYLLITFISNQFLHKLSK